MKTIIISLAFVILCMNGFAQARLNSTMTEIREEFSDWRYNLKTGYDRDGDFYISVETDRATVIYFFDNRNLCYITIIVPDDQGALNMYVELYNSRYVILSTTRWRMYTANGLAEIELVYSDDGSYYFLWTRSR